MSRDLLWLQRQRFRDVRGGAELRWTFGVAPPVTTDTLLTEASDTLTTEAGDPLTTEA